MQRARRETPFFKMLEVLFGLTVAVGALVAFVWLFVAAPMMANHAECGTIFLCSAQKN